MNIITTTSVAEIEASDFVVVHDRLLYAFWMYTREGDRMLSVYRSVLVDDDDDMYADVREIVGDTEPFARDEVDDTDMAYLRAEQLLYWVAA